MQFFDQDAALAYGKVRVELKAAGTPIDALDMLIAAQAVSRDLALLARKLNEFNRDADFGRENCRVFKPGQPPASARVAVRKLLAIQHLRSAALFKRRARDSTLLLSEVIVEQRVPSSTTCAA